MRFKFFAFILLVLPLCSATPPVEEEMTKENVYNYISQKCAYPEWVYKQMMLESGHLKSHRATTKFNIAGMMFPSQRKTLAIGKDDSGYAIFDSWKDCIDDYVIWYNLRPNTSGMNYPDYLVSRRYAQHGAYTDLLNNMRAYDPVQR